jgi:hypothetical protein
MAWFSSGNTNEELIMNMKNSGLIESDVVAEVRAFEFSNWLLARDYA